MDHFQGNENIFIGPAFESYLRDGDVTKERVGLVLRVAPWTVVVESSVYPALG